MIHPRYQKGSCHLPRLLLFLLQYQVLIFFESERQALAHTNVHDCHDNTLDTMKPRDTHEHVFSICRSAAQATNLLTAPANTTANKNEP